MPTPRHDLQAVAAGDKVYAISGAGYLTVDAVEIYDTETDTWTPGRRFPPREAGSARSIRRWASGKN